MCYIEMCHVYEQINSQTERMKLPNLSFDFYRVQLMNENIECDRCARQGLTGTSAECPAKR